MKWILLLAIIPIIIQYGEVTGYPGNHERDDKYKFVITEKPIDSHRYLFLKIKDLKRNTKKEALIDQTSGKLLSRSVRQEPLVPYTNAFYSKEFFKAKLALLERHYENIIEYLMSLIKGSDSKKDEKNPCLSESNVSNNNTQEDVNQTTPTPDESTNTQKPVSVNHDDKEDKPDYEKDPLHTTEIVTKIIPVEPITIKTKEKPEQVKQKDKKNTFVPINDENKKVIETPPKEIESGEVNPVYKKILADIKKEAEEQYGSTQSLPSY